MNDRCADRAALLFRSLDVLWRTLSFMLLTFIVATTALSTAAATTSRTFVASFGNDANACSLTLPCRSFAVATTQTSSGGEVIALDSAGYGPVSIAQSISIFAAPGAYAGITASAGTGIYIDSSPGAPPIAVALRGLTLTGSAAGTGIEVRAHDSTITIDNCAISNFGYGIHLVGSHSVVVTKSALTQNGVGVLVQSGAVSVVESRLVDNGDMGIATAGPAADINISIVDTLVKRSNYCVATQPITVLSHIAATRVTATGCGEAFHHQPLGGPQTMSVSNSLVVGNGIGFSHNNLGTFTSLGNNHFSGNATDTVGNITTIAGQ